MTDNHPHSLPSGQAPISTGHAGLDTLIDRFRLGDNVVWHVDSLEDYRYFANLFVQEARAKKARVIYIRFGEHDEIVDSSLDGVETIQLDPSRGFEQCTEEVTMLATKNGEEVFYVFDSLTELVRPWSTDELVANFFQTACPLLFELRTIAFFALQRGHHSNQTIARIYNTTQVFVESFHHQGERYMKMIKVWDRYSSTMFFTQRVVGDRLEPVFDQLKNLGASDDVEPSAESPWDTLQGRLDHVEQVGVEKIPPEDLAALRHEFSRLLIGRHPVFTQLADRYFTIESLFSIRQRLIGSGRIGGKAVGMLLAREILKDERDGLQDPGVLADHDSFYIGSDVFYTFIVRNDLFRLRLERTRATPDKDQCPDFETVEQRFLAGSFPPMIASELRSMLEYFGENPIIVRSSSLLEDSFGGAFAGKYRSEFCPNQGSLEQRMEQLTQAIKLVYASSLSDDAISYRRRRSLEGKEELMAILVQKVAGTRHRQYFFPSLAGVALSRNLYCWNDRIDPHKGVVRLVFGLGTRAVDRVGGDYPRLIACSHPHLRPEVGAEAAKYSQHEMDVLDLETNTFRTLPVFDVVERAHYPNFHYMVSIRHEDYLEDPFSRFLDPNAEYSLSFNNLLRRTSFARLVSEALQALEKAYGHPVDVEFTAAIEKGGALQFNLLQCRPLWNESKAKPVEFPKNLPDEKVLFTADRVITGGVVENIRYIVYIDPETYDNIPYPPDRKMLGRVVGRLNSHPLFAKHPFILMGPGRWGSGNVDLGVNVSYADIDNTNVLIELSTESEGHSPEVSYGTHFFQDLVEEKIIYLPVFTEKPDSRFQHKFFLQSPNRLAELLPEYETLTEAIRVIDLHAENQNGRLVADARNQKAILFLE
ncbi:MAG: PEP/pyruvate-binding domain-containing protein [Opitutales bacterium]|nr:PEP/pyruvate-binding domain-containing protein [Opitutales bacterium]